VVFAFLLALFFASVRYVRMTPKTETESIISFLNWYMPNLRPGRADEAIQVELAEFEQTREAAEDFDGEYRFKLRVLCPDADTAAKVRGAFGFRFLPNRGKPGEADILWMLLVTRMWWLENRLPQATLDGKTVELTYRPGKIAEAARSERGFPHEPQLFFGLTTWSFTHPSKSSQVHFYLDWLVGSIGASVAMLIGIVVTSFFIPNMLRKGTVDLLLVKPIHRSLLLIYKYIGGLAYMFLLIVVTVLAIWITVGIRSGIWPAGFLLVILVLTFQFAVYYACATLFGVLTRSAIAAIVMSCLLWLLLGLVSFFYHSYHPPVFSPDDDPLHEAPAEQVTLAPGWVVTTVDVLHAVLPRMDDLNQLRSELIARDAFDESSPEFKRQSSRFSHWRWLEGIGVSLAFIVVMLGLACWRFSQRDY
jgi:ABC-type transport system involved in multi-copper enzyme maturation permease subunit